jgi:hypothetical protein
VENPNPRVFVDNLLFVHDPGRNQFQSRSRLMASVSNKGDQGGADEAPTHPKLLAGGLAVYARRRGRSATAVCEAPESGNWQVAARDGLESLDELLEGEVDMEDDDVIEFEPEEEEPPPEEA